VVTQDSKVSDFQKWSVLAFRAMDDAGRVLMTIEPESTSEGEMLDQLKETIRELLTQALVLNGVVTRRQLDERFHFGKLDTDALNAQLARSAQEPKHVVKSNGRHSPLLTHMMNKRDSALPAAVAAEREACAKVCETEWSNVVEKMYGQECAEVIRARGQA